MKHGCLSSLVAPTHRKNLSNLLANNNSSITGVGSDFPTFLCDSGFLNVSIGTQKGPPIGVQKGPLCRC
jgi:hypothetical protein